MKSEGVPKQFVEINGMPLIGYTMQTILNCGVFDRIYIGLLPQYMDFGHHMIRKFFPDAVEMFQLVEGASRRIETFFNILSEVGKIDGVFSDAADNYMCLADANRPLTSKEIYLACMRGAARYAICCPAHPVVDGVCVVRNETICEVPNRDGLYSFQTPECFRMSDFHRICPTLQDAGTRLGVSEIFSYAGMSPHIIRSNDRCFKITTPIDFELFKAYIKVENEMDSVDLASDLSCGG